MASNRRGPNWAEDEVREVVSELTDDWQEWRAVLDRLRATRRWAIYRAGGAMHRAVNEGKAETRPGESGSMIRRRVRTEQQSNA